MQTHRKKPFWPAYGFSPYPNISPDEESDKFIAGLRETYGLFIGGALDLHPDPNEDNEWNKSGLAVAAMDEMFSLLQQLLPSGATPEVKLCIRRIVECSSDISMSASQFNYWIGQISVADRVNKLFREGKYLTKKQLKEQVERGLKGMRRHLPNRKYSDEMYKFFEQRWDDYRSQVVAYDKTAERFNLDVSKGGSFIRGYRKWRSTN